jgi:hypothetical protein
MSNMGPTNVWPLGGLVLDQTVEQEVLKALKPEAIKATLSRQAKLNQRETEQQRAKELALTQAEYEAERAFRQYNATEPENRLVAVELEKRWNEALREVERLKTELNKAPRNNPTGEDYTYLLELAEEFPRVWNAPDSINNRLTAMWLN